MQLMTSQPAIDINSPVKVTAVFDPPVVGVGEKAIYRILLNALEPSVHFPSEMVFPNGLEVTLSSRGQTLQQADKMIRPMTAVNFHARAAHPGLYTIPAFKIEVYGKTVLVPKAYLEVVDKPGPDHMRARELVLIPDRTNVFAGERVSVRVLLRGSVSNVVETLSQLQFNGEGFLDDKTILNQKVEPVEFNGRRVATWVTEASLTPFAPGQRTISVQAFTAGMHFMGPVTLSGQATILGRPQQQMLLDSDPVTLQVRPLPAPGEIKGFGGFMGNVFLERALLSTNFLRVGDAVRLLVSFHSENPLGRLVPPPPPQVAGWQIFPAMPVEPPPPPSDSTTNQDPRILGWQAKSPNPQANEVAAFAYTLIPLTEEVRHTPAIPFSAFDPEKAVYLDLTIPPLAVKVVAEGLPADWQPAIWAGKGRSEQKPTLSALAESPGKVVGSLVPLQMRPWFVPMQFVPALALLGLWWWDRRRRFLESHPELVRRRQARRALRRERRALRQAAASGDAPGFAQRAIMALQIAAAPHFPAEPRALVCGEVLSLFEHPERTGETGEVIRLFFECDERATFAANRESRKPLFELQPKLEGILERMEARL